VILADNKNFENELLCRQNRNLYAIILLDMILSKCSISGMFVQNPPALISQLPALDFEEVSANLSKRFKLAMQGANPTNILNARSM
jgi:hypothetical protein